MRITIPLAILLSVGWLLLVSVLASRGGGTDARLSSAPAGDAATLLRQSQAAMLELESFRAEMTASWEGREDTYTVAWQSPDSFHVLYPNAVAHYESGQETEITDHGFVEAIAIGERIYTRQCAAEGEDCQPWEENARERIYMPGSHFGQLDPLWTIELLGLVSDAQTVGQGDVGGVACTRLRGGADVVQASIRSMRRAEESRGPLDWGEECTGRATTVGGERVEECHNLTLDEYIAKIQESAAEEGFSDPVPIEIWVGEDDRRVRRFNLLQYAPVEVVAMSFTFSRFNEVTVEAPK